MRLGKGRFFTSLPSLIAIQILGTNIDFGTNRAVCSTETKNSNNENCSAVYRVCHNYMIEKKEHTNYTLNDSICIREVN